MFDPFDASGFVPRRQCGEWTPLMVGLDHLGNGLTGVCYYLIPAVLVWGWRLLGREGRGAFARFPRWTLLAGAAFIAACGLGHHLDILIFYRAVYRLLVPWHLLTGLVSVGGVLGAVAAVRWLARYVRAAEHLKAAASSAAAELAAIAAVTPATPFLPPERRALRVAKRRLDAALAGEAR